MVSRFFYQKLIRPFVVWLVNRLWVGKVNGLENLPKNGAAILVSNHASFLDFLIIPSIITKYINRPTSILAAKELKKRPIIGIFAKNDDCIHVDRTKIGSVLEAEYYKELMKELEKGKLLLLFPGGTRSLHGNVLPWKSGFIRTAINAKIPVIPIAIKGAFEILPKGGKLPKLGRKCEISFLNPIKLDEYYKNKMDKETAVKIANSIRQKVVEALL